MLKCVVVSVLLAATTACASTPPAAPTRLDAATVESAERSFSTMAKEMPGDGWRTLSTATVAINMKNVKSASDVVGHRGLGSLSIARIRTRLPV